MFHDVTKIPGQLPNIDCSFSSWTYFWAHRVSATHLFPRRDFLNPNYAPSGWQSGGITPQALVSCVRSFIQSCRTWLVGCPCMADREYTHSFNLSDLFVWRKHPPLEPPKPNSSPTISSHFKTANQPSKTQISPLSPKNVYIKDYTKLLQMVRDNARARTFDHHCAMQRHSLNHDFRGDHIAIPAPPPCSNSSWMKLDTFEESSSSVAHMQVAKGRLRTDQTALSARYIGSTRGGMQQREAGLSRLLAEPIYAHPHHSPFRNSPAERAYTALCAHICSSSSSEMQLIYVPERRSGFVIACPRDYMGFWISRHQRGLVVRCFRAVWRAGFSY